METDVEGLPWGCKTTRRNVTLPLLYLQREKSIVSNFFRTPTPMTMQKKCSERRKHCALAVVRQSQNFCPATDPFPGARDGQNLISQRWSLPLLTNPVCWGSMHAISSYRGNRPTCTHPQTLKEMKKSAQRDSNTACALAVVRFGHCLPIANTKTHRQDRLQYTALQLASAQCNKPTDRIDYITLCRS